MRGAVLDVAGFDEPVMGQLVSVPENGEPLLNRLALRAGRYPQAGKPDEVVLSEPFALAHKLGPGDHLRAVMSGRWRNLVVVGVALSPEYVYTIGPGALMPDDHRYGVLWMGRETLQAAYDLEGAFNEVSASLLRGAESRAGRRRNGPSARSLRQPRRLRARRPGVELVPDQRDRPARNDGALPADRLPGSGGLPHQHGRRAAGGGRASGDRVAEGVRLRQYRHRLALRETRARDRRGGNAARLVLRLLARPLQHHHVRRLLSVPVPAVPAERRPVPARRRGQRRRRAAGRDRGRASSCGTVARRRDAATRPAPVPAQPAVPATVLRAARPTHAHRAAPDLALAAAFVRHQPSG